MQLPFDIVHLNVVEAPAVRPVTPEVLDEGVVTDPVPDTTVHVPVPVVGEFPASVAVVVQTVWSGPAADVVGRSDAISDPNESSV